LIGFRAKLKAGAAKSGGRNRHEPCASASRRHNLSLSDQRAKSVAEFLIENFHIDPKQLVAIGFGEEKLKNSENPLAAENRRVQVVNMASKDVAAKAGKPAEPDKQ